MRYAVSPRDQVLAERLLSRFFNGGSIAELTMSRDAGGRQLQLEIDHSLVFRCAFGFNTGVEQLRALASTTRHELEQRGWVEDTDKFDAGEL